MHPKKSISAQANLRSTLAYFKTLCACND